jgi:glycosyltransferase involved in cell wall biosynthesis
VTPVPPQAARDEIFEDPASTPPPGPSSRDSRPQRPRQGCIAVVLKGYPRLSETFIAQEILALEQRGFDLRLISLRHPTDKKRHPVHDEIRATASYLPEYLYQEPLRVLKGWWRARRLPGYTRARSAFLRDLRRDLTPNRIRRFGQACVLAIELPRETTRLFAHFLHTPASVARYTAEMTGLPWSVSAHAKDIWTLPDWEKREKLAEADWLVTCTGFGAAHLRGLADDPGRVHLVYHGLDLDRFAAPPQASGGRNGSDAAAPVRLLSVGRAVEKKGYDLLLQALADLPPGLQWHFTHIGGGPLRDRLERRAEALGLTPRITWLGAQAQAEVLAQYGTSDLFVLASRIAADGDRDGLPNVLMEAQSQGLACLSTRVAAIPELIEDGVSGALVAPEDAPALSVALARLIADPAGRRRLGDAGQQRILADFDMKGGIERLVRLLDSDIARQALG